MQKKEYLSEALLINYRRAYRIIQYSCLNTPIEKYIQVISCNRWAEHYTILHTVLSLEIVGAPRNRKSVG